MSVLPKSFFDLVKQSEKPVLVDFWAPWCGPCRSYSSVVAKISKEFKGRILTVKVNTDEKQNVASFYQIQSIPTTMLFYRGEILFRINGAYPFEKVKMEVENQLLKIK